MDDKLELKFIWLRSQRILLHKNGDDIIWNQFISFLYQIGSGSYGGKRLENGERSSLKAR